MQIDIPQDQFDKLSERAVAAGFGSVPAFLQALANSPVVDPRGTELSEQQLRESVAMIERGNSQIDVGEGVDLDDALRKIAEKHGFQVKR